MPEPVGDPVPTGDVLIHFLLTLRSGELVTW
jgi:hypothetical protein